MNLFNFHRGLTLLNHWYLQYSVILLSWPVVDMITNRRHWFFSICTSISSVLAIPGMRIFTFFTLFTFFENDFGHFWDQSKKQIKILNIMLGGGSNLRKFLVQFFFFLLLKRTRKKRISTQKFRILTTLIRQNRVYPSHGHRRFCHILTGSLKRNGT